jgi:hypothetical protein
MQVATPATPVAEKDESLVELLLRRAREKAKS